MPTPLSYDGRKKPFAQKLRRDMTPQERHLWYDFLKSYPVAFRRQKQFGSYIVDFYCANAKLVVELDGSQHYEEDGQGQGSGEGSLFDRVEFICASFQQL